MLRGSLGIGSAYIEILLLCRRSIQAFGGFSPAFAGCGEMKGKSKIVGKIIPTMAFDCI